MELNKAAEFLKTVVGLKHKPVEKREFMLSPKQGGATFVLDSRDVKHVADIARHITAALKREPQRIKSPTHQYGIWDFAVQKRIILKVSRKDEEAEVLLIDYNMP